MSYQSATELAAVVDRYRGKTIEIARIQGESLWLTFADGTGLSLSDERQDCCEHRYMVCGDDLQSFTGDKLVNVELRDAPASEGGDDAVHEVQFLLVQLASGSVITCETHNEHNGYYGGFNVCMREVPS